MSEGVTTLFRAGSALGEDLRPLSTLAQVALDRVHERERVESEAEAQARARFHEECARVLAAWLVTEGFAVGATLPNRVDLPGGFWISAEQPQDPQPTLRLHGPCPRCGEELEHPRVFRTLEVLGAQLSRWSADTWRWHPCHPPQEPTLDLAHQLVALLREAVREEVH